MDKQRYGDLDTETSVSLAISDTNAHVIRAVDMRRFDRVGIQLITDGTLDGNWKVEISQNAVNAGSGVYGQVVLSGDWTDVTSGFSPSIVTVAHGTAATQSQYAQADIRVRAIRVSFTATAGTGNAKVNINAAEL